MKTILSYTLIVTSIMMLLAERLLAIPAFARKYDMSCSTCHTPFPKLKPYGDEFAGNGFQLPDKEPPRFYRDTGDDRLLLMRELPFALRLEGYGRWQPQSAGRSDFESPYLLKLLSGGQVAKDVSYYFYFFYDERGDIAGLEDAFIMFNNLFSSDLDVYFGQFQVSDPLFKRELRLMLEDYQVYRMKPGLSRANLTYDRGVMLTYGLPSKTDVVLEVLNGSGLGGMDATRSFDPDKYKNFALRVSQDVTEGIRAGGFGYYGKEEQSGRVNTLWMAGPDISFSTEHIELNLQYVERRDKDPAFIGSTEKTTSRGAMCEMVLTPNADKSMWYAAALYNWAEIRPEGFKYHSATGHFSYLLARNLRLIGEYTYDLEMKANKLSVGFVSAF